MSFESGRWKKVILDPTNTWALVRPKSCPNSEIVTPPKVVSVTGLNESNVGAR